MDDIKQGNAMYIDFSLSDNSSTDFDIRAVERLVITIGSIEKYYPEDIEYLEDLKVFRVTLSQDETFSLNGVVQSDIRVKYKNGIVDGSEIYYSTIKDSLNKEIL